MRFKKIMGALLSASMIMGTIAIPAHAELDKAAFFDSVQRYISFDEEVSDYFNHDLTAQSVTLSEGKYGKAGKFDGSASNIDLGKLDFTAPKEFSISFWMNPESNSDKAVVTNKDWGSYANPGWIIAMPNNNIRLNATSAMNPTATALTAGKWVYVTAVFQLKVSGDSQAALYLDGKRVQSGTCTASDMNTAYHTYIGRDGAQAKRFYKGLVDEFILTDKALTEEEIQYAMNLSDFETEYRAVKDEPYCTLTAPSGQMTLDEEGVKVPVSYGKIDASLIQYRSLNELVASVDADGTITALAPGSTVIKVDYNDDNLSYHGFYELSVTGASYSLTEVPAEIRGKQPYYDTWALKYTPIGKNEYTLFEKVLYTSAGVWCRTDANEPRLSFEGTNHHPSAAYDPALEWTAPESGTIHITGPFMHENNSTSDGIKLSIIQGNSQGYSTLATMTSLKSDSEKQMDATVTVEQGDKIYFRLNCISSASSDHTTLKPTVTYVGRDIHLDQNISSVMMKPATQSEIGVDSSDLTVLSLDESVATAFFEAGKIKINALKEGTARIFLQDGTASKMLTVTVTNDQQPYRLWFEGAAQTTPDSNFRIYAHFNTGSKVISGKIQYTVCYDNQQIAMIDTKDNELTQANSKGRYTVSSDIGAVNSDTFSDAYTKGNYKHTSKNRVNTFYAKTIGNAAQTNFSIEDIIINGTYIQNELCSVQGTSIEINQNPVEDKNDDGLISVGDVAKAAADGETNTVLQSIAQKAGFYPIKRVFVIGLDGAGNSMDPDNAWYWDGSGEPRRYKTGEKPAEHRWDFFENTMMPNGAYTFDSLSCSPAASAQNWTAILHGYRYNDGAGYEKIDNHVGEENYFPEDVSKYSSFAKIAREEMPNRRIITNINWNTIDNGIIEQSVGAWIVPWSSRVVYREGIGNTAKDVRDVAITAGIAEQIEQGYTKNMSILFAHMDMLDYYGEHADGFYTDSYYRIGKQKDSQLQDIYEAIFNNEEIKDDSIMICTTDHGGYKLKHGTSSNYPSEKYSFISLNGAIINPDYKWGGDPSITDEKEKLNDKTRSETCDVPSIVAKSLGLTPDPDWKGQLKGAENAFLEQKEMVKKNRDIETVTYTDEGNISIENLKNTITSMDLTVTYSGDTAPQFQYAPGTQELAKTADAGTKTVRMVLYNENGFAKDAVKASAGVCVENVMLAVDSGKEIYADIVESTAVKIRAVTDEKGNELTLENAKTAENINVAVQLEEARTEDSVMIAAVYDGNGTLLQLETAVLAGDSDSVQMGNPAKGYSQTAEIKLMWFDNVKNMNPICGAKTIK